MNTHVETWAEAWAGWAAAASWQIAVLIILIALVAFLSRRLSARFRYLLWMLVIVKALTPPTIGAAWSIGNYLHWRPVTVRIETTPPQPQPATEPVVQPTIDKKPTLTPSHETHKTYETYKTYPPNPPATPPSPTPTSQPWSLSSILLLIWSAGFLGLSSFILVRYLILTRTLSRGSLIDEGPLAIAIEKLALRIGRRNPPALILSGAVTSPFLFGLLRPRIVLPAALPSSLTPDQLDDVLLHELIHWRRRDILAGWLQILVQALFWFHPLVWLAGAQLRHERECACDEAALESGLSEPRRYGESLLKVLLEARGRSAVALGFLGIFERNTRLQRRLEEIMNQESKVRRLTVWSWAALALFAIASLPMAEVQPNDPSLTPLHRAAMTGRPDMVKLLIAKGANVNTVNRDGLTPLDLAVIGGHQETAAAILAGDANINAKDPQGKTPLMYAAEYGHEGMTAFLIGKGADVKASDRLGRTALHWAAMKGKTSVVKPLLTAGADINATETQGKTPLDFARQYNQPEFAQMLEELGAGMPPLLFAAKSGDLKAVQDLLKKGADVKTRDDQGETALHLAVNGGHQDIAEALLTAGAEIDAKDDIGRTPLAIAVERGHSQLANFLISRGADVNARADRSKWNQAGTAASAKTITVPAKADAEHEWVATGVMVAPGDVLHITATGSVSWDPGLPKVGPEGAGRTPNESCGAPHEFLMPAGPCGGLIGKVGTKVFFVGSKYDKQPAAAPSAEGGFSRINDTGELYLAVNDRHPQFQDNSGEFTASISKTPMAFEKSSLDQSPAQQSFATPADPTGHFESGALIVMPAPDGRIRVSPVRQWSDTNIDLKAGDEIEISAEGKVFGTSSRRRDSSYGPWGPEGTVENSTRFLALIGKIDARENATQFILGRNSTIKADGSGRLYLGVADSNHFDNTGEFIVTIKINGKQVGLEQLGVRKLTAPTGNLLDEMVAFNGARVQKEDGNAIITADQLADCPRLTTRLLFQPPLSIRMRAKTDSTNIRVYYGGFGWGELIFNWEVDQSQLRVHDLNTISQTGVAGKGFVTPNMWHNIQWDILPDRMRVLVDGQLHHEAFGNYADVISRIGIGPALGSAVTVSSVEVAPIATSPQVVGRRIILGEDRYIDAPTTEAAVLYNQANDFFRTSRWAQCIDANDKIHRKYPGWIQSEPALREIGLCYRNLGMRDKAIEAWLRAVTEWPALKGFSETTYADLIDELVNQKQFAAAEKYRRQLMDFANNGQLDSHRIGDRFRRPISPPSSADKTSQSPPKDGPR
ncbi:ankyrin repeat domain-containing protein [bacterium]|nr:ankyrin repeat domain-containing protein [bacterium]